MRYPVQSLLIGVCLSTAATAGAQRLTGVVRDSATRQPVSGAVVMIVGTGGGVVGRTTTNATGAFALAVSPDGQQVQLRRIGFLPRDLALPPEARTGTVTLDLNFARVPTTLPPVVRYGNECAPSPSASAALALWEQARLGFLAAVVARDATPAQLHSLRYKRSQIGTEILTQSVQIADALSTVSFATRRAPETFATRGFRIDSRFSLPDADVLLHESFRDTHCFTMSAELRPAQIGIAFSPAGGRSALVDISGVVWLNAAPLALRSMEFQFTNITASARRAGAGGFIDFTSAANGVSFIDRWEGRVPYSGSTLHAEGGQVLVARWADGTVVSRALPEVTARVVDSRTREPIPGISVSLVGSSYSATTDATGTARLRDVLPGPYELSVVDSTWLPFGLGREVNRTIRVDTTATVPTVTIPMQSLDVAVQGRCAGVRSMDGRVTVLGMLTDADDRPTSGRIHVRLAGSTSKPSELEVSRNGQFTLCGLTVATLEITAFDAKDRRVQLFHPITSESGVFPLRIQVTR